MNVLRVLRVFAPPLRPSAPQPPLVHGRSVSAFLCSHPKCGRTWLRFMLCNYMNQALSLGMEVDLNSMFRLLPNTGRANLNTGRLAFAVDDRLDVPLVLASHQPYHPNLFDHQSIVFLMRSPIDVLSSHFCERVVAKGLDVQVSASDTLIGGKRNVYRYCDYMNAWADGLASTRSLVVTFEQLKADGPSTLSRIASFLALPIVPDALNGACERSSLDRMRALEADRGIGFSGRSSSRARKGSVGGHKAVFSDRDVSLARRVLDQRLSDRSKAMLRDHGLLD